MEPHPKRIKPTKIDDGTNGKHPSAIEKNTGMFKKLLDSYEEILKVTLTIPILERLIAKAQQYFKKSSTSFKQSSEFTRLLQNQNNLQPLQHFEALFKKFKANKQSSAAKSSASKEDGETPVENENDSVSSEVYNKDLFEKFLDIVKEKKLSQGNYAETELLMVRAWTYFNNCKSSYKNSAAFEDLLRKAVELSTVDPGMQMKTVLDELKFNKKCASQQSANVSKVSEPGCSTSTAAPEANKIEDNESDDENELSGLDPQVRKKVKMLERTLRALNLRIRHLEEREVDFSQEDDENSAYMKLDRYSRRFDQVYKKICQLKKQKSDAGRVVKRKVSFPGGEIEKAVEKHYNKTNKFPDFHDILKITKEVKKNDKLPPNTLHSIAQKVFEEFGRLLQRRRKMDVYESACFYLTNTDPADQDPELKARLEENYVKFKDNEKKVIDMYAEKSLGVEPEEVGSSVSNDEDETEKDETRECDSGDSSDDHGKRQSTVMDVDDYEDDTVIEDECAESQEKVQGERHSKGEINKGDESKNEVDKSKSKADESKSRADKSKSKSDESKNEVDKSKSKADESKSKADQSKNEADKSKSRADKSKSKADQSKNEADKSKSKADKSKSKADESKSKNDESTPVKSCSSKDTTITSNPGKTSNACSSKDSEGINVEGKKPDILAPRKDGGGDEIRSEVTDVERSVKVSGVASPVKVEKKKSPNLSLTKVVSETKKCETVKSGERKDTSEKKMEFPPTKPTNGCSSKEMLESKDCKSKNVDKDSPSRKIESKKTVPNSNSVRHSSPSNNVEKSDCDRNSSRSESSGKKRKNSVEKVTEDKQENKRPRIPEQSGETSHTSPTDYVEVIEVLRSATRDKENVKRSNTFNQKTENLTSKDKGCTQKRDIKNSSISDYFPHKNGSAVRGVNSSSTNVSGSTNSPSFNKHSSGSSHAKSSANSRSSNVSGANSKSINVSGANSRSTNNNWRQKTNNSFNNFSNSCNNTSSPIITAAYSLATPSVDNSSSSELNTASATLLHGQNHHQTKDSISWSQAVTKYRVPRASSSSTTSRSVVPSSTPKPKDVIVIDEGEEDSPDCSIISEVRSDKLDPKKSELMKILEGNTIKYISGERTKEMLKQGNVKVFSRLKTNQPLNESNSDSVITLD